MRFRRSIRLAALSAVAALGGCGGVIGTTPASDPNATDAAFARAMASHHRATRGIGELGARRALRPELRRIARSALERHDERLRRIDASRTALRARAVSPVGGGIREPPPFDARALRNAVSFDHDFLARMIRQHEYTVAAAAAQRDRGGDPGLTALAAEMHAASARDLATLRRWLRTWYGQTQPMDPPAPPGGGSGGPGRGPEV